MHGSVDKAVIEDLRRRVASLEGQPSRARAVLPFGVAEIDGRLPEGGLQLGALHEVAGGGNGAVDGAAAALFAAGVAARTKGQILWCFTRQDLFAAALAQAGLAPERVIYVEAGDEKSVLACFEEGARHGGLGAVVAEVARLSMTSSRRLHLAAEPSGTMAIAVRRWRRQSKAAPLDELRWKNRVLVVVGSPTDPAVEQQRRICRAAGEGMSERSIVLTEALDGSERSRQIRSRLDADGKRFQAFLVGKDGHTAITSDKPLSVDYLFGKVDAMPMRRDEMKRAR
jgi:protein ImuA